MKTNESIKGIIKPSELTPFITPGNLINTIHIIACYSIAAVCIYTAHRMNNWAVTIFCMFIMGGVHHTLATFIHEAAHGHVFNNKKINDRLGHFFFAAPSMTYLEDYRYLHWEHHRHTGKVDRDPELGLYRAIGLKTTSYTKGEAVWEIIKSVIGISSIKGLIYLNRFYMGNRKNGNIKKPGVFEHAAVAFWWALVPALMYKLGMLGTYILVFIVPIFTFMTTALLWHGIGEHIREKDGDLSQNTFGHNLNPLFLLYVYPIQSGFHLEHHLYPQLPWYSMRKFRKWADQNPEYKRLANQLTADSFFVGEKSIIKMSFGMDKKTV